VSGWPYGRYGIVLATEELSSNEVVLTAQKAEAIGLGFVFVSDHFHPWNENQGRSSNSWPLLGALAQTTRKIGLVSAVTCPIFRLHPTTLAQSASTVFQLSEGRFVLGLGTGEYLNEGIVGGGWPSHAERLERLVEFVDQTRELLGGGEVNRQGKYYRTEGATLFDSAPDLSIYFAASGPKVVASAREKADGLICLGARPELAANFANGPCVAQISVCWAEEHEVAVRTAHRHFPEVAMPGNLFSRLRTPAQFSRAAQDISLQDVEACIACGPEPEPYLAALEDCFESGFQAVAIHQIGRDQDGFLRFWQEQLYPRLAGSEPFDGASFPS
jgi:G6PDH family F420-dependent oxidoreductase